MPAQSDPTLWRTHPQRALGYLFVLQPAVVVRAQVEFDATSDVYPRGAIRYKNITEGSPTDVIPGMTVVVGTQPGYDDLGRTRVRGRMTNAKLEIAYASQGTHDGEVNLAQDAYLTVYDDFRIWSKVPRINDEGIAFKDFKVKVQDNTLNLPPVANGGPGWAGFADPDTLRATVTFPGDTSWAVTEGETITDWFWDFGAGSFYADGEELVSNPTVDFTLGFRWVHLTVTDSNGKEHTCHVPVYVSNPSGHDDALIEIRDVSRTLRAEGQELSFTLKNDMPLDRFTDGTLIMYWEDEFYGNEKTSLAGVVDREHVKFIGWIAPEDLTVVAEAKQNVETTRITALDVNGRLSLSPGFPLIVVRHDTPTTWDELFDLDMTKYYHYLLHWHSTALELADFLPPAAGNDYVLKALSSSGESLYDQVDSRAQAIAHRLVANTQGQLMVNPDPILIPEDDRTAVVIAELDEDDFSSITVRRNRHPRNHWLQSGAVRAITTKVKSVLVRAPGDAPGQGLGYMSVNNQLTLTNVEFRNREGNRYARTNSRYGFIELELIHSNDGGIEPAPMEWVTLTATDVGPRKYSFVNQRCLVVETRTTLDAIKRTKRTSVTLEVEVVGTPATLYLDGGRDGDDAGGGGGGTIINDPPEIIPLDSRAAAVHVNGWIYITRDFNTTEAEAGPFWRGFDCGVNGTIVQFIADPASDLFQGTGDQVDAWLVTTTRVYHVTNIFNTDPTLPPTFTSVHTFASTSGNRTLAVNSSDPDRVAVATYYLNTNVRVLWTDDHGGSWTEVTVTSHSRSDSLECRPGLHWSPFDSDALFVTAFTSTGATPTTGGYYSLDGGASWAAVTPGTTGPDLDTGSSLTGDFIIIPEGGASRIVIKTYYDASESGTYEIDFTAPDHPYNAVVNYAPFQWYNFWIGDTVNSGIIGNEFTYKADANSDTNAYGYEKIDWAPGWYTGSLTLNIGFGRAVRIPEIRVDLKFDSDGIQDPIIVDPPALGTRAAIYFVTQPNNIGGVSFYDKQKFFDVDNDNIYHTWTTPGVTPTGSPTEFQQVSSLTLQYPGFPQYVGEAPEATDCSYAQVWIDNIEIDYEIDAGKKLIVSSNIGGEDFDDDISPSVSDESVAGSVTVANAQLRVGSTDIERILLIGSNQAGTIAGKLLLSRDAGENWEDISSNFGTVPTRIYMLGDDDTYIVVLGTTGEIEVSLDDGVTSDERTGNIASIVGPGGVAGMWIGAVFG
jgi:hypothetical protein